MFVVGVFGPLWGLGVVEMWPPFFHPLLEVDGLFQVDFEQKRFEVERLRLPQQLLVALAVLPRRIVVQFLQKTLEFGLPTNHTVN